MKIKDTIKKGIDFGLTSGAITTLGLIIGLDSTTGSKVVVISGIITIAIADAFSDALGSHISEEAVNKNNREVWEVTVSTFLTKLIFALSFLLPVLLLKESIAIFVSIIWGVIAISFISYKLAKSNNEKPLKTILEHLAMALVVMLLTHFVGNIISKNIRN